MTLVNDNFENAKRIVSEFPMIANVPVDVKPVWKTSSMSGLYDPDDHEICIMEPNLIDGWTLTHEYAHAISGYYTRVCRANRDNLPANYFRVTCGKKQLISLEMRFCIETGHTKRESPSKYGKTNNDEFGAEMLRDYYQNGDACAPVSREYHDFVINAIGDLNE